MAIVVFLDHYKKHIRIQFLDSKSKQRQLGFSGTMEEDGQILDVMLVYLEPTKSTLATDGVCKLFFEKKDILSELHLKGVYCGAKIDKNGRRSVQSVAFEADPGQ
jgi:hypothetical protein